MTLIVKESQHQTANETLRSLFLARISLTRALLIKAHYHPFNISFTFRSHL